MRRTLFILAVCSSILFAGCSAKAKLERHVKRADAFFEKGDHEKARIEYLNAFQLERNNPHVAARLGESFLKDGDIVNAYRLLSQAVSLQPTNTEARVNLASVLLLGGEPVKAREHALEVLKQSPLHPDGLLVYANTSLRTNEIAEARARFESLRELLEPVRKSHGRRAFIRVTSERDDAGTPLRDAEGRVKIRLAGGQGSHVISALAKADALAIIPEADDELPAGAPVALWWLDET